MSRELQNMKLLLSEIEKIQNIQTYQQYEPIVQALQGVQQYMNESRTNEVGQYVPELVSMSISHIMNHMHYPDQILIMVEKFIKSVLLYINKNIFDEKISIIFCKIMDPNSIIYQNKDLSTNWHDQFTTYSYTKNNEYKQFVDNLKEGTYVDCIRSCQTTSRLNWNRAIVEKIQEDLVIVRFLNEQQNQQIFNIKSGYLMPYQSRSQRLDSMFNLQEKQAVLATQNDKWVLSTILNRIETSHLENVITYTIRFHFQSILDESKENEKNYKGQSSYHDEQLTACNPRLALCGDHIPRKNNSNEFFIDDSYDILYEEDYKTKKFYAILRPRYSQSLLLIRLINYFGSLGGFEQILAVQSVDILANYMHGLGNINGQLYRYFCQEYVPKLQALKQAILHSDEQSFRNMGREKINLIIQAYRSLLDRIMTEDQRKEWLQSLGLEFAVICFNGKFLDKKIIGLKLLTDLLKQADQDKSPEFILEWIERQGIFESLFHHSTHLQLLERTKDLIKIYLTIDGAFKLKYLSIVWDLMQSNDKEVRSIIFKLFNDIATFMSDYQAQYFLEQIKQLSKDLILIEHVQLLCKMNKNRINQQHLFSQVIEILWDIIEYVGQQGKTVLEDQSRTHFIELIQFLNDKDIKRQMIQKLITNIKQQKVESSSLKVLQQIICTFLPYQKLQQGKYRYQPAEAKNPLQESNNNFADQKQEQDLDEEFIKGLIQQQQVHHTLRESIDNLYSQNLGINADDPNETTLYINKLQERLILIQTLIMIYGTAADMIDQQFLDLIWNKHILKPVCKLESEIVSFWLRDLIEKDECFSSIQLNDFYHRLLRSDSHLNENAFKCFKLILYYVNQKDYRIQRQSLILNQICDDHGNLQSTTNANNQEKDEQMDFQIMVDVKEILGIQYLWHIVLNSSLDSAIKLLVKLNLSQQEQFIKQILDKMNTQDEQIILRCFDILRELLNETEKLGIGKLLSLDGLIKGESFKININSDIDNAQQSNNVTITVHQSLTIFELRKLIAKEIKTSWEQIKLFRNGIVIQETDNGKTLKQLSIKKSDFIKVCRRNTKPIPKVPLIEDTKLSPLFLKVIMDLFNQYSTNERMSLDQFAQFGFKASKNESIKQDEKIYEIFVKYSSQGEYLTLNNLIAFFQDCCLQQQNSQVVWQNLYAFGYRNDLSLMNADDIRFDQTKLPRHYLAQNQQFYQQTRIFMAGTNKVAQECWKLLCSLPIFGAAKERILNFEDLSQDTSYQLIYSLKIIEYLLQNQEYCRHFIIKQGFMQLQFILNNLQNQEGVIRKLGQLTILNIFTKYIAAQFRSKYNKIFEIQQHVKQPMSVSLDLIGQLLQGKCQVQDNKAQQKVKESEEFLELVKQISDLDIKLDYANLLKYLINTPLDINEDRQLIEYILVLITTLIGFNLDNCTNFFIQEINQIKQRYKQLLFAPKQLLIRKFTINSLYLIYRCQKTILNKSLIQMLKDIFPSLENKDSQCYFDLLAKLILEEKHSDKELANTIILKLYDYEPNESRVTFSTDKTYIGLLSILESLCIVDSSILTTQLIRYLYAVHLFYLKLIQFQLKSDKQISQNYVKSKSPESRKIVYRLIVQHLKQNFNLELIDLQTVLKQIGLYEGFEIKIMPKSSHGFVGIRNLGCICFMNAMMQQFFMTPEFRYCMLRAEDGVDEKIIQHKDNQGFFNQIDDNPFHQFQKMLASLDLSDRADFNPYQFCLSYKDNQNQPLNVSMQQDAQEFLNQFFDRLDNQLKEKGWQQFIEAIYGGYLCSQMICNGCQTKREKFDLFYTLSLKVKDVKSLYESFESMIQGEVIKDYKCEQCQQKNDLIKRQCLSKLPNVLIVHLQRIVFNLDLYMNEKLSSHLEFPHVLNLSKYTREALSDLEFKQDSYYQYKLKGVVVHQGTAECGHYYSLINTMDDKWLKFNDSVIEEFDINLLSYECFGGKQSEIRQGFQPMGSTNAYILVYERTQKETIELKFSNLKQKQEIMSKFECELEQNSNLVVKMNYQTMAKQFISEALYGEIQYDNHKFMMERHIYSDEFFRFVKEIAEAYPFPPQYQLITNADQLPEYYGIYSNYQQVQNGEQVADLLQNLTYIAIELLSRSSDHGSIKDYVLVIINLINIIPSRIIQIFQQIIIQRQNRVFEVLLCAPNYQVRQAIQQILLHYINVITYIHAFMLNTSLLFQFDQDNSEDQFERSIVHFLVNLLQKLQNDVAKNASKFAQYFNFWKLFIQSNQIYVFFANQIELVSILADFFMEKQSPRGLENNQCYEFLYDQKIPIANLNVVPFYSPLFQCINYLLQNENYQLTKNDRICIESINFYKKALKECQDFDTLQSIILKVVFNNLTLSRGIIEILLEEIQNANYENVGPFLKLVESILNIEDNMQQDRIQWILGYPQPCYSDNFQTGCSINLSQQCITYLTQIGCQNETMSILNQLFSNRQVFLNMAIQMMRMLLNVMNQNKAVFSYIIYLPPPSYLYAKYTDWFETFLNEFKQDCIKYPAMTDQIFFNREQELEQTVKLWEIFKTNFNHMTQLRLYDPMQQNYIIGNILETGSVQRETQVNNVYLETHESLVYFIKSNPNRFSNKAFPQAILKDNIFIQSSKIEPSSNIFFILNSDECFQQNQGFQQSIQRPANILQERNENICSNEIGYNEQQQVNDDFINELQSNNNSYQNQNVLRQRQVFQQYEQDNKQEQQNVECNLQMQVDQLLKRFMINNQTDQTVLVTFRIIFYPDSQINFLQVSMNIQISYLCMQDCSSIQCIIFNNYHENRSFDGLGKF
ncbi:unnamed protein product (macronuclear) [Paramecium tetraurelia]|uniref:USP domain-containing protein n=1 Tax=Paramecium tetraurelia TaxID=5888 RepID=A0CID2_PARTE|nr:uncharacterized protein GSPATT00007684001 [Paramecium tetraurelia]CAK70549.1 unnamed protein product [Paramecium tetraurelia]|eukprot:XP_001437946.1 hypothetical protein (macronuclear) [Paramecium tetraurelia strain d4-2]